MSSTKLKPVVLRLGDFLYSQQAWSELEQVATVLTAELSTREQIFKDFKTKYSDVEYIARTYNSSDKLGLFDKEFVDHLPPNVKVVAHCSAGYDQIDPYALSARKIQLSNVVGMNDNATADTTIYLILGALRFFNEGHHNLIRGDWLKPDKIKFAGAPVSHDPMGKTVGIVGLGSIGRKVLDRLQPFGFERFVYYNRNKLSEDLENGAEYVSFDELLAQSDIISIHVPLNKHTTDLFNDDVFAKVKKGVVIVNTSRGGVIDEVALMKALKDGTVASAGLDVFKNEPNVNLELANLPNVLALPHIAAQTVESLKLMEEATINNVSNAIKTGKVVNLVSEHRDVDFDLK